MNRCWGKKQIPNITTKAKTVTATFRLAFTWYHKKRKYISWERKLTFWPEGKGVGMEFYLLFALSRPHLTTKTALKRERKTQFLHQLFFLLNLKHFYSGKAFNVDPEILLIHDVLVREAWEFRYLMLWHFVGENKMSVSSFNEVKT